MYKVADVSRMPLQEIITYVKQHYPPGYRFYATEPQLRYLAVIFLDKEGYLDPHDSTILHEPYIGQVYVAEGGSGLGTVAHFFENLIPGVSYL